MQHGSQSPDISAPGIKRPLAVRLVEFFAFPVVLASCSQSILIAPVEFIKPAES